MRNPYPLFVVALAFIIAVCLNPKPSVIKAAETNGGQKVTCTDRGIFETIPSTIERFLRENPTRRIEAFSLHGGFCIVHEPVR